MRLCQWGGTQEWDARSGGELPVDRIGMRASYIAWSCDAASVKQSVSRAAAGCNTGRGGTAVAAPPMAALMSDPFPPVDVHSCS